MNNGLPSRVESVHHSLKNSCLAGGGLPRDVDPLIVSPLTMAEELRDRRPEPWSPLVGASMHRFLAVIFYIGLATVPNFAEGKQEIAVPSYVYPCFTSGCAWEIFKTGASIVVINPKNGPNFPDSSTLSAYSSLVDTVKQNSTVTTVLGYVSTQYGARDSSSVLGDIDLYYQNFTTRIDGIFLDEGSPSCDEATLASYKAYDDRVKTNWGVPGFTALNWGAPGSECYLTNTSINTFCTFEGNYSTYTSPAYNSSPGWVFNYSPSSFWHIVHTTPNDEASVQAGVSLSTTRHAGNIYFTDAVYHSPSDNPYNVSASTTVWQTEVIQVNQEQ